MVYFFIIFLMICGSIGGGFCAGTIWGKYFVEKTTKNSARNSQITQDTEQVIKSPHYDIEDMNKAQQDFDRTLKEKIQLQEDINNRITSRRMLRLKKTIDTAKKRGEEIENEIRLPGKTDVDKEKLQKELNIIHDLYDSLSLVYNHLKIIPKKVGSPLAAKIISKQIENERKSSDANSKA
jgi:hypothetical protein